VHKSGRITKNKMNSKIITATKGKAVYRPASRFGIKKAMLPKHKSFSTKLNFLGCIKSKRL
jgi:hypothetical protein